MFMEYATLCTANKSAMDNKGVQFSEVQYVVSPL